ncbi:tyrosine-type recombinase/integrase [Phycobacter sp. K97]|uniref:tyrosine-type recombinase/integrase n=1 Tax=Phycobacter sedimenti TaxID=3133977 RepID=UPI00311DB2DC
MSRSYKGIRLKKNRVYSTEDLQRAYAVSANTISNWRKAGLRPSDGKRPYVFRGGLVMAFHKARHERLRTRLNPGEFKCTGCKSAVFPELGSLTINRVPNGASMAFGQCSECGCQVRKFVSDADLVVFERLRDPNTTVDSLHEGIGRDPGGIGISAETDSPHWWGGNDRVVYNWQVHAGRLAEQTIDQHLSAIRFMEEVLAGKPFDRLTVRDVDLVRSALKGAMVTKGEGQKSRSTASHQASQIMSFLEWLIKQDGYKRLPADLPSYIQLPKAAYAEAMPKGEKAYASLEEAEGLLRGMPALSLADRRARAMFAIAYLGALRADTITSLRLAHFDQDGRKIIQDATTSRTKNGKSLRISWFPIAKVFVTAVVDWVEQMQSMGLREEDALFPSLPELKRGSSLRDPVRAPIEPMASKDAVAKAFALACRDREAKYNPHSVKDTLAAERDRRPLTQQQRKAWSENMGHESEKVTEIHYGKLPEAERFALFEEIANGKGDVGSTPRKMTDAQKIALLDELLAKVGWQ